MKNLKKVLEISAPAGFVLGVLGLLFVRHDFYPFGNNTISWCDMNQQVVPLLLDFKDMLEEGSGFFLSFANGGGMNFWGVFFFFLASPFSFLVLLVDKADVLGFMNVLTALKLACCALTANLYFRKSCRRQGLSPWVGVLLSLLYAFSAYGLLYYQNSIWLDEMYLFPLLLLSFEELREKGRTWPYVLAITAVVVVNYYISYMVILFTLLYFGLYFWQERKNHPGETALRFIGGSGIAALISAVVWLPAFRQYLTSGRGSDVLNGLASCSFFSRFNTTLLLLLASGAIFGVLAVSRILGVKRAREYRWERWLFLLLCIPVFLEPINRMWHTGSYMAFPTRYGFMTIFMGLCCVLRVLKKAPETEASCRRRNLLSLIGAVLAAAYIIFTLWFWQSGQEKLTAYVDTLWGSNEAAAMLLLVFALSFAAFGILYMLRGMGARRRITLVLAALLILAEARFNLNVYMASAGGSTDRYKLVMDLNGKIEEDGFWRIKTREYLMEHNMEGALGYPAISHYTSLTSEEYMFLMKHLGYSSYWMKVGSYGGTKFSDALLSVRYQIERLTRGETYVYANEGLAVRRLEYTLPLGLLYEKGEEVSLPAERIPFQEALFQTLWNTEGTLFEAYSPTDFQNCTYLREEGRYRFIPESEEVSVIEIRAEVKGRQTLYLDCFDRYSNRLTEKINGSLDVSVNGVSLVQGYPRQSQNGILELGTFEDEEVVVRLKLNKELNCASFGVYGLKEEVLEAALSEAGTIGFEQQQNGLRGSVQLAEEKQCFLAVPYDPGFTLTIDGQKASYEKVMEGFIGFTVPAGYHEISLTYRSPGWMAGLVLTGLGFAAAAAGWLAVKRKKGKISFPPALQRTAQYLCQAAAVVVLAAVYVFPLVWNLIHF